MCATPDAATDLQHLGTGVPSSPREVEPTPLEDKLDIRVVEPTDCALLRILVTPAIGSCIYSCIALGMCSSGSYYEWTCVHRHTNGVAKDHQRALHEQQMARGIANKYKPDIDPEHTPEPNEYEAIARTAGVTLDVHFFYGGVLVHFQLNPGSKQVVRVLWTCSGGHGIADGKGHFDFMFLEPPDLSQQHAIGPQHGGWGQ